MPKRPAEPSEPSDSGEPVESSETPESSEVSEVVERLDSESGEDLEEAEETEKAGSLNRSLWVGGVDEAGRGPSLGPLCVAAVVARDMGSLKIALQLQAGLRIRDSKKMSDQQRNAIWRHVVDISEPKKLGKHRFLALQDPAGLVGVACVVTADAEEISTQMESGVSLDRIEAKMAVFSLRQIETYLSTQENGPEGFSLVLDRLGPSDTYHLRLFQEEAVEMGLDPARFPTPVSEKQADDRFEIVSLASILAKESREQLMAEAMEPFGEVERLPLFEIGRAAPKEETETAEKKPRKPRRKLTDEEKAERKAKRDAKKAEGKGTGGTEGGTDGDKKAGGKGGKKAGSKGDKGTGGTGTEGADAKPARGRRRVNVEDLEPQQIMVRSKISGYPSDKKTVTFLRDHLQDPKAKTLIRTTFDPAKSMLNTSKRPRQDTENPDESDCK